MNALELTCEVAEITHAYLVHNFFYTEKCSLEQGAGFLHPEEM